MSAAPASRRRADAQAGPSRIRPAVTPPDAPRTAPRRFSRWRVISGFAIGTALLIALVVLTGWPATWVSGIVTEVVVTAVTTGLIVAWRQGHLRDLKVQATGRYREARAGRAQPDPVPGYDGDGQAFAGFDDDVDVVDDGSWRPAPRVSPAGSGPAGRRAAARQRAVLATRQFAVPKVGAAPAEFVAVAGRISEFRSDDGDDLQDWLDGIAAGLYAIGEAISDAHDGLVNETGLDEIPAAAVHDAADQVVESGGALLAAKDRILTYYEDPINFAESGGKMTKDGGFWESH